MKFYYVIKEYIMAVFQSLAYVYKFDRKGTIYRLSILILFPVIANYLNIANAKLADSMQQNFGAGASAIKLLVPIFLVIVGFEILNELFSYLGNRINWTWRRKLRMDVDIARQEKKSKFTIPFIDSEDYDQLNQRISLMGDGFDSQMSLVMSIPQLFRIIVNISFAIYIIGVFNPLFALLLAVSVIPMFYVSFTGSFARRKNMERHLDYRRYTGVYGNQFSNYVSLKDTKVSGSTDAILRIWRKRQEFFLNLQFLVYKKYLNLGLVASLIALCVGFFIQYVIITDVISGLILIGQATLIITQSFKLQSSMDELASFLPDQYENVIAAKYLFLYLKTEANVEKTNSILSEQVSADIEINNVVFQYPEVQFNEMRQLNAEIDTISEKYFGLKREDVTKDTRKSNDFTLTIPHLKISKGERVAIVGKNGNGKTTFLQLVLNLYPPENGSISLFGNETKEMNQTDVQNYFSVLFQDYGQTSFKLHEYVGLSDILEPSIERVKQAAKLATADEFIEKWKDTYTQQLGVAFKGVKPSKGQWQKLALARAFYKNAPIIVLDEPTSAIDAVSAKSIFKNLAELDPEKILLFVCHNMADIPLAATRILVFENGNIVGDGSHEVLLKKCPQYKELYDSEMDR